MEYGTNIQGQNDFQKRLGYTKVGFITLAICLVLDIIVRIVAIALVPDPNLINPGDTAVIVLFYIQIAYYSLKIIISIISIAFLLIGFLKLFEHDKIGIKNSSNLATILLAIYIGISFLFQIMGIISGLDAQFELYNIISSIVNIISFVLLVISFFLMNKIVKEISVERNKTKTNFYAFYLVIVTGLAYVIYYIISYAKTLPNYSVVIVFSLYTLTIFLGCIEFVIYLKDLNESAIPNQKIEQNEI